jgi:glycosyltransferase involved in cell wall biosynthesis
VSNCLGILKTLPAAKKCISATCSALINLLCTIVNIPRKQNYCPLSGANSNKPSGTRYAAIEPSIHLFEPGVTLVGYVSGEFGVAENLRMACSALKAVSLPVDIYKIGTDGVYCESDERFDGFVVSESTNAIQIFCVNADQISQTQKSLGHNITAGRYKIGYWFWELSNFPTDWWHAFDYVDEIWAPTKFIAETLLKVSPKPVIHMPVPVAFSLKSTYSRKFFSLPDACFLFLFSYDFHSYSQRKNPEACVTAFMKAFETSNLQVGLVIKTIYAEKHPQAYSKLLKSVEGDDRIIIINKVMPRDEMYGLISVCDSFLSLHRSEGFGLGMAEAMLLGKPVIATGYSGNMDFMNTENSCVVDFTLIAVEPEAYPHWEGQVWAEPNIIQASDYMKEIFENQIFRETVARNGQEYIQKNHSHTEVGTKMKNRLVQIDSRLLFESSEG